MKISCAAAVMLGVGVSDESAFEGDFIAVLCYSLPLRCDYYAQAIRVRPETC